MVVPRITEEIVVGLAWLDKWGPTIWWGGGCQHLQIGLGPNLPLHEEQPPIPRPVKQGGNTVLHIKRTGEGAFPKYFHHADLVEVFSEQECDNLPPHHSMDCVMETLPGAKLPKPKMYSMTSQKMIEMRAYIENNLKRGFIQPARSRVAAPILFWEKKDGGPCLCVNFQGINAVCVEYLYPLPLMKDMLACLVEGCMFTKL